MAKKGEEDMVKNLEMNLTMKAKVEECNAYIYVCVCIYVLFSTIHFQPCVFTACDELKVLHVPW